MDEIELNRMREQVTKVYPGDRWADRVKKMSSAQIVAIYNRFKAEGKFK